MKKFTLRTLACVVLLLNFFSGFAQTDVLMQHNDLNRTGWNNTETELNQTNVTPTTFGILYQYNVDDQIYAQPLVASRVSIKGSQKNVVYVATVNNTVYAFDADDGSLEPYWERNFTPVNEVVPNAGDIHASLCVWTYPDFTGKFGIVGTPVIDKASNTIYFVTRYRDPTVDNAAQADGTAHAVDQDWSSNGFYQQLHALDLSTGLDKFGSPVTITATVNGTGDGGTTIQFDARRENQREGLVLSNGIVYITYAGHCDMNNYHGWVLGYKADDISQQLIRFVTTPNNGRGGTWMSGAAPAVDAGGNLFFNTGNANNGDVRNAPGNLAMSVIKAAPDLVNHTLNPVSWFKPAQANYDQYNGADLDFGTGVLLIPGQDMLVTAHKSGFSFVLKQNAGTGEFAENSPNLLQTINIGGQNAASHSSISYFGGAAKQYVYEYSEYTDLKAFPVIPGSGLGPAVISTVPGAHASITGGGFMSVSSNGTDDASGILWVTHLTGVTNTGTLHALKANDISYKLWSSDDNIADTLGLFAKMNCVTVANGKVYAPTASNNLKVYGLLSSSSRCSDNVALNKTAVASTSGDNTVTPNFAVDGNTVSRWAVAAAPSVASPQFIYVDLGGRYNICKINVQWNNMNDYGIDFTVDISEDAITWTTLNTVTGNSFSVYPLLNEFNEHAAGRYVRVNITQGVGGNASISEFRVFGVATNNCIPPTIPAIPVSNITEHSATLNWVGVTGIQNYVVRYKSAPIASYITKNVVDASGAGGNLHLDVSGLTCGEGYSYTVQSDCGGGFISDSVSAGFTMADCASSCVNETRWGHADFGEVQVAGSSCYSNPVFTISGAGTGIGGNNDQFQFDWIHQDLTGEFIAHLISQDNVAPNHANQAGIMVRESLTDNSPFIFLGKTPENKIYLLYRNTAGGSVNTLNVPYVSGNDYFRIVKSGTEFTASFGSSDAGPWTTVGTTHDLGFGGAEIYQGFAVSSLNPAAVSTATFSLAGNSTGLPITMSGFTATNVDNKYIALKWVTEQEVNNDHFEIEHSQDGTNFTRIDGVKSQGNSSIPQSYTFIDNSPYKGLNYYRLKQVDSNGRYSYSEIIMVKFGTGLIPEVRPNPVHANLHIIAGTDPVKEVVIYNAQGRAVNFLVNNSGTDDMNINVSILAKGVYFLKIKTEPKIFDVKIVKE